jgi:hypothetical protein
MAASYDLWGVCAVHCVSVYACMYVCMKWFANYENSLLMLRHLINCFYREVMAPTYNNDNCCWKKIMTSDVWSTHIVHVFTELPVTLVVSMFRTNVILAHQMYCYDHFKNLSPPRTSCVNICSLLYATWGFFRSLKQPLPQNYHAS